jgi:hypothetical protein
MAALPRFINKELYLEVVITTADGGYTVSFFDQIDGQTTPVDTYPSRDQAIGVARALAGSNAVEAEPGQ